MYPGMKRSLTSSKCKRSRWYFKHRLSVQDDQSSTGPNLDEQPYAVAYTPQSCVSRVWTSCGEQRTHSQAQCLASPRCMRSAVDGVRALRTAMRTYDSVCLLMGLGTLGFWTPAMAGAMVLADHLFNAG